MTIYDEESRDRRWRYHERIQITYLTSHLNVIEKNHDTSHERSQRQKHKKTDILISENTIETYQIMKNNKPPLSPLTRGFYEKFSFSFSPALLREGMGAGFLFGVLPLPLLFTIKKY